ncbi:MAG: hypothetical protein A2381_11420 [Bdellovibrionales bacterium RIFOXYB1_FULL_37_110]|nr:MAG: hypothetical protein A2417_11725 [Bdellovibrionales bacterium RIFOXYC1_FULL_37_79]OFZ57302.1 MAG: hypothetical protein A2381_11420 [Bdellovibrionales bacterium RIFOXYB1_FULL_37_110]OFZ62198.1 MAG: hypothetical protein A2577_13970 [Bdellovibrionales bacterium RIFOXYD1_FULL_36_51]
MPGGDKTGPMGQGPRTGKGMGLCSPHPGIHHRSGFGYRRRCGRGMGFLNRFGNLWGFIKQALPREKDLQSYLNELEAELNEGKEVLKNIIDLKNKEDDQSE